MSSTPKARGRTASLVLRPTRTRSRCLPTPSRAAVTRQGAALAASPQGLTADPAHNPLRSAGVDAVHPADITAKRSPFAVHLPHPTHAPRPTTHLHPTTAVNDVSVSNFAVAVPAESVAVAVTNKSVAFSVQSASRRAPMASAGPSDARTQGGPRSIAAWSDRGRRSAPARRRQRCATARGLDARSFPIFNNYNNPNNFNKRSPR